ncbi:allantoinase PuuE [Acinetobacter sp. VNK23]|uniref:allantoinase PuuE n=1 Tax=Acinetobacter thutiue TaxID=2998078 RepID=UPI002576D1A6|nr:allantoinase PuuE [Acinetobacter thutiue]MDM1020112.1 allantoinase PuuE [Acinetobacter thutiue]
MSCSDKEIDLITNYPRDMVGYANHPPHAQWPNQAKIAVQFVLNYEEGGEKHILHGDEGSEQFLSEISGVDSYAARHLSMDSIYEYGSRVGFWRIQQEFAKRNLPMTIFAVAMALQRNPLVVEAIKQHNYDVVSHGLRWIHYQNVDIETEKAHMAEAMQILKDLFGQYPTGWYTGRDSPNTRQLLANYDHVQYDSDYYGDDLPFWTNLSKENGETRPHLIIPYTLDTNDMKFASPTGFNRSEDFFEYLKDAFDVLYTEGATSPKMLSIGMHCRILGRPARFKALQKFLDYVQNHDRVWICTRQQIAEHWMKYHPDQGI